MKIGKASISAASPRQEEQELPRATGSSQASTKDVNQQCAKQTSLSTLTRCDSFEDFLNDALDVIDNGGPGTEPINLSTDIVLRPPPFTDYFTPMSPRKRSASDAVVSNKVPRMPEGASKSEEGDKELESQENDMFKEAQAQNGGRKAESAEEATKQRNHQTLMAARPPTALNQQSFTPSPEIAKLRRDFEAFVAHMGFEPAEDYEYSHIPLNSILKPDTDLPYLAPIDKPVWIRDAWARDLSHDHDPFSGLKMDRNGEIPSSRSESSGTTLMTLEELDKCWGEFEIRREKMDLGDTVL